MADIFISYANEDRDAARLLAAFLEAEGYSVWWDTSLLSGESFRKTIMTELGRARAAIVIWTEASINSDWVQSEAGRAHADRKLIPVKSKAVSYRDIPPPFDNMHIENMDDREKISAALVARLAEPEIKTSAPTRFFRKARFELFSWVGIAGGVITLTTNLQSVLRLADWVHWFFESWALILQRLWQFVFFFLPKLDATDAIFLTFISFSLINLMLCLRTTRVSRTKDLVAVGAASIILVAVFWVGWDTASGYSTEGGYYLSTLFFDLDYWLGLLGLSESTIFLYVYQFVVTIVIPLVPVFLLYGLLARFTAWRLSIATLAWRLWRIVAGIGVLLAFNYLSLWIEHQAWFTQLIRS